MTKIPSRGYAFVVVLASAMVAGACSSTTKPPEPPATPTLEQVGATVVKYVGQDIEVALSYRFAAANLGQDWLLLDLAVTGTHQESTELKREKIALRTPSGDIIPLPLQEELTQAYSGLRAVDRRADIASEPLRYWGGRRQCVLNFLVEPGSGLAMQSIWVNQDRYCEGRFYFPVPGGVQSGKYELRIDLKESKARIPFQILK
jgi:hypothetical protein